MSYLTLEAFFMRLSVIIPMYNVEQYVERCLRSLEEQDIPKDEYEIICINDGSPDDCRGVVTQLQSEFDNIVLIDQENQGVSMARNNGIDIARGKYLLMVDPDDYVSHNILGARLEFVEQFNLDIGFTGFIILNEQGEEEFKYDPLYRKGRVLTGIEYYKEFRNSNIESRDPHRTVAIFFRRDFLNLHYLRYLPDIPYLEDGELLPRAVCLSSKVMFINQPFYYRTTRPGSATHSDLYYSDKARNGFIMAANNLLQFRNEICRHKEQKQFINCYIVHFTVISIISMGTLSYFRLYREMHNKLKTGPLRKLNTEGCSSLYKKMGNQYNVSMHWFYLNWLMFRIKRSLKIRFKRFSTFM